MTPRNSTLSNPLLSLFLYSLVWFQTMNNYYQIILFMILKYLIGCETKYNYIDNKNYIKIASEVSVSMNIVDRWPKSKPRIDYQ